MIHFTIIVGHAMGVRQLPWLLFYKIVKLASCQGAGVTP